MVRVPPLRSLLLGAGLVALGGCQTKHHIGKIPPERPAPSAAASPRPLPQGTHEGADGGSLLDEYVNRRERPLDSKDAEEFIPSDAEVRAFSLPNNSKKLVTSLLTFAAQDNLARARTLFTEQARWGSPDRREPDARPISEAGGQPFFDALRDVASRLGRKENLSCPPIMPAATIYVRNGAEPMWCFYISNDNLDILAFKFIHEGGTAKIDFVGFHPTRQTGQIQRPGALPPPMTPNLRRAPRVGGEQRMPPGGLSPDQLPPGGLPPGLLGPDGQPLLGGGPAPAPITVQPGQPLQPTPAVAPLRYTPPTQPPPAKAKPPAPKKPAPAAPTPVEPAPTPAPPP